MMNHYLLFLTFFLAQSIAAQTVLYVDQNQMGNPQDGSSWASAFRDLQQALALANESDAIWVANGTYYPTDNGDKTVSFVLKQGVKLYGGFSGDELDLSQRDWTINLSILSGDIGVVDDRSDNSFHVLYGSGIDSTTVLDGFVVTKGRATGAQDPYSNFYGGGLFLEPSFELFNTSPIIQHCRFEDNFALEGAGIHAASEEFGSLVNPIVRHCVFQRNVALNFGGAIYKMGRTSPNTHFLVEDCHFLDNSARAKGGGALSFRQVTDTVIFRRCTFERDSSEFAWGGALYFEGYGDPQLGWGLLIDSCLFYENFSPIGAAILYREPNSIKQSRFFNFDIKDSHFEANTSSSSYKAVLILGRPARLSNYQITNTIFFNNQPGALGVGSDTMHFQMQNCQFIKNGEPSILPSSSKILLSVNGLHVRADISNCLFAENGDGLYFGSGISGNAITNITNSTFYQNNQRIINKTWYPEYDSVADYRNDCYINNCVFWEYPANNKLFTNWNTSDLSMHGFHIDYSLMNKLKDTTVAGAIAAFGDHMIFGASNIMFEDTLNGDFRLKPCSPAVNAASNIAAQQAGLSSDLDGSPRIFKDVVDMGAYETQDSCFISSVKEIPKAIQVMIYPNPVQGGQEIRLDIPGLSSEEMTWDLLQVGGQMVSHGMVSDATGAGFNLKAPVHSGLYFLHLKTKSAGYWGKVLVE